MKLDDANIDYIFVSPVDLNQKPMDLSHYDSFFVNEMGPRLNMSNVFNHRNRGTTQKWFRVILEYRPPSYHA